MQEESKYKKLKLTIDDLYKLNQFIYFHSMSKNLIGQEYKTSCFYNSPEKYESQDPWKYKINKYGYRGNNWLLTRPSIPFFGCSNTFGIGVKTDLPSIVENSIGVECNNLGQPGSSCVSICKTFLTYNRYNNTDLAVIILPSLTRFYYPDYHNEEWNYGSILPNHKLPEIDDKLYKSIITHFTGDTNIAYVYDYIKMVEFQAATHGTTILWTSWEPNTYNFLLEIIETKDAILPFLQVLDAEGRDGLHPGQQNINKWGKILLPKIKKLKQLTSNTE